MKIIIILFLVFDVLQADVKLIASPTCRMNSLFYSDVKQLFMLINDNIMDEKITVLDTKDKKVYKDFSELYLKKSIVQMKIYWTRMLFSGIKKPPRKIGFKDLGLESKSSCKITYVETSKNILDWKVINVYSK